MAHHLILVNFSDRSSEICQKSRYIFPRRSRTHGPRARGPHRRASAASTMADEGFYTPPSRVSSAKTARYPRAGSYRFPSTPHAAKRKSDIPPRHSHPNPSADTPAEARGASPGSLSAREPQPRHRAEAIPPQGRRLRPRLVPRAREQTPVPHRRLAPAHGLRHPGTRVDARAARSPRQPLEARGEHEEHRGLPETGGAVGGAGQGHGSGGGAAIAAGPDDADARDGPAAGDPGADASGDGADGPHSADGSHPRHPSRRPGHAGLHDAVAYRDGHADGDRFASVWRDADAAGGDDATRDGTRRRLHQQHAQRDGHGEARGERHGIRRVEATRGSVGVVDAWGRSISHEERGRLRGLPRRHRRRRAAGEGAPGGTG